MPKTTLVRTPGNRVEVRVPADANFVRYMIERSSRRQLFADCDAIAIRTTDDTLACTLTMTRGTRDRTHEHAICAMVYALAARAKPDERQSTLIYLRHLRPDLREALTHDIAQGANAYGWQHAMRTLESRCRQSKTAQDVDRRLQKALLAKNDANAGLKSRRRAEKLLEAVQADTRRIARRHALATQMAESAHLLGPSLRRGAADAGERLDAHMRMADVEGLDGLVALKVAMSSARCVAQTNLMLRRVHEDVLIP